MKTSNSGDYRYECTGVTHHAGGTCEHCGKGISNIFILRGSDGTRMMVGSECVKTLTDGTETNKAMKFEKRIKRASRQWNDFRKGKNAPSPQRGETRENYINRRLSEMEVALSASKKVTALQVERERRWRRKGHPSLIAASRFMHMAGYTCPGFGNEGYGAYRQLTHALSLEFDRRWKERIAKQFCANAYDIFQPIWKVRDI